MPLATWWYAKDVCFCGDLRQSKEHVNVLVNAL
jgi:hypothetical protein